MITKERILDMLLMQDSLERRISGEDWKTARHNFELAIYVECAEMVDHYGWKWWKAQDCNTDQVALELVDVWHFVMAWMLVKTKNETDVFELSASIASVLELASDEANDGEYEFVDLAASLGCHLMTEGVFSMPNFVRMCAMVELSFDGLYTLYCSKNVLNRFRQDMGYADGSYAKEWGGKEDNEHLFDITTSMPSEELTSARLYDELSTKYAFYSSIRVAH